MHLVVWHVCNLTNLINKSGISVNTDNCNKPAMHYKTNGPVQFSRTEQPTKQKCVQCFSIFVSPNFYLLCISLFLRQPTSPLPSASGLSIFDSTPTYLSNTSESGLSIMVSMPTNFPSAISIWLVCICFDANLPPHCHQHLACIVLFLRQLTSPMPSASSLYIFVSTPTYLSIAISIWLV